MIKIQFPVWDSVSLIHNHLQVIWQTSYRMKSTTHLFLVLQCWKFSAIPLAYPHSEVLMQWYNLTLFLLVSNIFMLSLHVEEIITFA